MICEYGCEKEAKYQFKNGKWCCEDNVTKCLGVRKKMSEAQKGENHPMFGKSQSKETRKKQSEALKGRTYEEVHGKEKAEEKRKKQSEALKDRSYEELYGEEKAEEIRKKQSEAKKGRVRKPFSKEHRKNMSEALKGENNPMFRKTHSEETRKKQRIAAIKNIERRSGQLIPNYNPDACKLIKEYGIKNRYDFQHAENGGEFYIKELGYWVDGYDKNKNVVIEVDEPHHFDPDGNLKKKDIQRQQEITNFLDCKFIRLPIN